MNRRNAMPQGQQGNMMIGGGESSYVSAEMLKQVSVPVEGLLGAVNGVLSGVLVSGGISTAVAAIATAGKDVVSQRNNSFLKQTFKELGSNKNYLWGVLAGTTALATLGGIVRYSRAVKHNEWSVGHYAHLEHAEAQQRAASFTDQVDERRAAGEQGVGRS